MPVLNLWEKLTKKPAAETVMQGVTMAESEKGKGSGAKREERAAARAQKRQARESRQASRKTKSAESAKPERLCSLTTVEVRKSSDGFLVAVDASNGRRSFTIAPDEASQVLRDLETAIQVIRGRQ